MWAKPTAEGERKLCVVFTGKQDSEDCCCCLTNLSSFSFVVVRQHQWSSILKLRVPSGRKWAANDFLSPN